MNYPKDRVLFKYKIEKPSGKREEFYIVIHTDFVDGDGFADASRQIIKFWDNIFEDEGVLLLSIKKIIGFAYIEDDDG